MSELHEGQTGSFAVTGGKGFHIQLSNGWNLSVQFGYGNYCENRYERDGDALTFLDSLSQRCRAGKPIGDLVEKMTSQRCENAEIAIWGSVPADVAPLLKAGGGGDIPWISFGYDEVQGYVTPDRVVEILMLLKASDGVLAHAEVQEKIQALFRENEAV